MVREKRSDRNDQSEKVKGLETYTFTRDEIEIVNLIARGFSNKEIAKLLSISEKTVKYHLTKVYAKFSVKNRYQLIVYVKRLGSRYKLQ